MGDHLAFDPDLDGPIKLPKLPRLTRRQREAVRLAETGGFVTPYSMDGSFERNRHTLDSLVSKRLLTRLWRPKLGVRYYPVAAERPRG